MRPPTTGDGHDPPPAGDASGGWRALRFARAAGLACAFASAVLVVRALPLEELVSRLDALVVRAGPLGLVVYGVAYVLLALLFVPGAALTLGAGALFGVARGLLVVWPASTTAAALAFLAARHLLRPHVEALARRYPRFRAVDRAVAEGGWRVVALLRLSPAVPYSAGNYLFGLTAVRFWPYTLASAVAMLPGALLYVSLGATGRAAAGGSRTPGEWMLLLAGLLATLVVTVYLARLARRALGTAR